jgi:hypothetical protein
MQENPAHFFYFPQVAARIQFTERRANEKGFLAGALQPSRNGKAEDPQQFLSLGTVKAVPYHARDPDLSRGEFNREHDRHDFLGPSCS